MGYKFEFDWGESWFVTENDFEWDREYWCKVIARHIHFFREKEREVKSLDLITTAMVFYNEEYKGLVSVSDNYVHVIMKDPEHEGCLMSQESCWMVDEL